MRSRVTLEKREWFSFYPLRQVQYSTFWWSLGWFNLVWWRKHNDV
jgi:hypothetical protein